MGLVAGRSDITSVEGVTMRRVFITLRSACDASDDGPSTVLHKAGAQRSDASLAEPRRLNPQLRSSCQP